MQINCNDKTLESIYFSSDQRQVLADLEFKIHLPAIKGLAMKSGLSLPWNKMRALKRYRYMTISILSVTNTFARWLSEAGIKLASEKSQRLLSKQLITTEIVAEIAPFTHSLKKGGEEVKSDALAYTPNLCEKVFEILEQHSR